MLFQAIQSTLVKNGNTLKIKNFTSCQSAYLWYKNNSDKPIVLMDELEYGIYSQIKPDSKLSCNFPTNEKTIITSVGEYWWFICAHKEVKDPVDKLLNDPNSKIAVWNFPTTLAVFTEQLKAIHAKVKIVPLATGSQRLEAFNTKDVDFYTGSTKSSINQIPNSNCFLTTADTQNAKRYINNIQSIETLGKSVPFVNYSVGKLILGYNVNLVQLKYAFEKNPSDDYINLKKDYASMSEDPNVISKNIVHIASEVKPYLE